MQVTILLAFTSGLLAFFSACILPLIPVFLASMAGPEIFEEKSKRRHLPLFWYSLSFVIGFTLVFTLFGAGSGLIGAALQSHLDLIRKISGALLTAFGVFMLASLKIPWLNYSKHINLPVPGGNGYVRAFIMGAVFPVAWVPCTSWTLGGILLLAGTSQTAWNGALLLAVYSLGLGLPFLILGAAFDTVKPLLKKVGRYSTWFFLISGLLLIVVGILVLTNQLFWFQSWFQSQFAQSLTNLFSRF
jgi:cytochrome c-type biogenesis protein